MPATYSIESIVQTIMDKRDLSAQFLGELAALYGIPGSSQTRISQALREAKPFTNEHEPLRTLVEDIDLYCESVAPVPVSFRKPALIKNLLNEFRKTREPEFVHPAYVIEFSDLTLLQRIEDGGIIRTDSAANAAPIRDKETATAAANLLNSMGCACRAVLVRIRTSESKMARNLTDLGFTEQK